MNYTFSPVISWVLATKKEKKKVVEGRNCPGQFVGSITWVLTIR